MRTLALTREELVDLVQVIAVEVLRASKPAAGAGVRRLGSGLFSSSEAAVDARSIPLTPGLRQLAGLMDHTLLRPQATRAEVEKVCEEARLLGFAAVCVNSAWVQTAAEKLRGTPVKVATVAGFPLGAGQTSAKRAEAEAAIRAGAREVDMVMNIGALKSGDHFRVENDIRGVAEFCRADGTVLKVILENSYLSDEEKVTACHLAQQAGAQFVKTSTGFGPSGATAEDVRLMRQTVGPKMGVKAAGGIRTLADALRMLQAGASRLGTSASVAIIAEAAGTKG